MAVDFKDLDTPLVSAPVRVRRRSARAKAPVVVPNQVIDLTVVPAISPVVTPTVSSPADSASYWVRRRRAEAQAAEQA